MRPRRLLFLALILHTLWLGLQIRRTVAMSKADRILRAVETSTTQALAAQRVPAALLLDNAARLTQAERLAPASASIRLAKGSQYLLLGRHQPAIRAYLEALRLEPRPEIYLNLGRAQWRAGLEAAALDSFEIAAQLDPNLLNEIPLPAADAFYRRRRAHSPPSM